MGRIEIPFAGSSKQHRSLIAANQICRNYYLEIVRDDQGKESFRLLIGTPGKKLLANVSAQPCRAMYVSSSKYAKYWGVFGDKFYEFINNDIFQEIGTLTTNQGPVYIADNGTHMLIVDGSPTGYVYDIANGTPAGWTADLAALIAGHPGFEFIGGDHVVYFHGQFIVIHPGTNVLQTISAPYGTAPTDFNLFNAGDEFSTALTDAGPLIALGVANDLLWAIGDFSVAIFQDTANPTNFPFSLVTGVPINVGTSSRAAVKELNGSLIWPAKTKKGEKFIVRTNGLSVNRISDHALESNLGKYIVSDSYADCYIEEGHSFYQFTCPTGNQTWCWDEATGEWHERSSYGLGRDRAFGHISFLGRHIVGDSTIGKVYQSSLELYTEDTNPLIAVRRCQHLKSAKNPLEIPALIIDVETGVGLGGDVQGSDPQMLLRTSNDSGRNWSDEMYSSMGTIGDTKAEVRFPKLGTADDWVFETQVSDPVKRNILAAYVEA